MSLSLNYKMLYQNNNVSIDLCLNPILLIVSILVLQMISPLYWYKSHSCTTNDLSLNPILLMQVSFLYYAWFQVLHSTIDFLFQPKISYISFIEISVLIFVADWVANTSKIMLVNYVT